jgi:predicted nuclease with TOPRIM domain
MAKEKFTLTEAADFAGRVAETLKLAAEAEAVRERLTEERTQLENSTARNAELKSEQAKLEQNLAALRQDYAEYATLDQKTKRERELDMSIAEKTQEMRHVHQEHAKLLAKVGVNAA